MERCREGTVRLPEPLHLSFSVPGIQTGPLGRFSDRNTILNFRRFSDWAIFRLLRLFGRFVARYAFSNPRIRVSIILASSGHLGRFSDRNTFLNCAFSVDLQLATPFRPRVSVFLFSKYINRPLWAIFTGNNARRKATP